MEKIEGKEKLLGVGSVAANALLMRWTGRSSRRHVTYPNPNATSKHIPNHTQVQSPCQINRHGSIIPDTSRPGFTVSDKETFRPPAKTGNFGTSSKIK